MEKNERRREGSTRGEEEESRGVKEEEWVQLDKKMERRGKIERNERRFSGSS